MGLREQREWSLPSYHPLAAFRVVAAQAESAFKPSHTPIDLGPWAERDACGSRLRGERSLPSYHPLAAFGVLVSGPFSFREARKRLDAYLTRPQ